MTSTTADCNASQNKFMAEWEFGDGECKGRECSQCRGNDGELHSHSTFPTGQWLCGECYRDAMMTRYEERMESER
jgi:hypothetical protein